MFLFILSLLYLSWCLSGIFLLSLGQSYLPAYTSERSCGYYFEMDRSVNGCCLMQTGKFVYILFRYVWFSLFFSFLVYEKSNKSKFTEGGNRLPDCKFMHNYANIRQSEGKRNLFSPRLRYCSKVCSFFLSVEYLGCSQDVYSVRWTKVDHKSR
jgi:hypothetical protein